MLVHPKCSFVFEKWKTKESLHGKGRFIEASTEGEIASICQDPSCKIVDGLAKFVQVSSALQAETLGCLETLECILSRSEDKKVKYILEFDSFNLISFLSSSAQPSSKVAPLITECTTLVAQLPKAHLAHCHRMANKVADWSVKAQRCNALPCHWASRPPQALWNLVCSYAPLSCNWACPYSNGKFYSDQKR